MEEPRGRRASDLGAWKSFEEVVCVVQLNLERGRIWLAFLCVGERKFPAGGKEMRFLSYSKKCFTILSFLRLFTNQEIFLKKVIKFILKMQRAQQNQQNNTE